MVVFLFYKANARGEFSEGPGHFKGSEGSRGVQEVVLLFSPQETRAPIFAGR